MEWAVLSCVLFASCLSIQAEPAVGSGQDNKSKNAAPAAVFNSGTPEREGALLQLKDYMDQGDALLKDRLTESYTNLKELLKEGDSVLKDQLVESVAQVKEQRKEGDGRLKEELDEDVAWLKDKLAKGQTRMKVELAEEEAKMKEELAEQREALRKLKNIVEQLSRSSCSVEDADLKQQMADFQAELKTTTLQLQTTQTELNTSQESLQSTQESLQSTQETLQSTQETLQSTQESLQSTQETLQSTQESLQSTQESLQSTQESLQSTQADLQTTQEKVTSMEQELQRTREQLQSEVQASRALMTQLQTAEDEIVSLKVTSTQSSHRLDQLVSFEMERGHDSKKTGSTFIRWGRTICPDNTSLVYSGFTGGSKAAHYGGASNYLCLVKEPQLDTMWQLPPHSELYGAEYESINEHHNQNAVCSVCRAPQPTTLMIPATLTCPDGWTTQYRGRLVSEHPNHEGRTEYVCLDEVLESSNSEHEEEPSALLYLVVTRCGSLPCPPYVNNKVVTCVVCSM